MNEYIIRTYGTATFERVYTVKANNAHEALKMANDGIYEHLDQEVNIEEEYGLDPDDDNIDIIYTHGSEVAINEFKDSDY